MARNSDEAKVTPLQARLRIRPHTAAMCGVAQTDKRVSSVARDGSCTHDCCDVKQTCRAVVTIESDEKTEQRYVPSAVTDHCVCPVFDAHECVSEIEGYLDGRLLVSVTVHDRDELKAIVNGLRDRGASVELESIMPLESENGKKVGERQFFDISTITDKQREAVEIAVKTGYYDQPRGADLDELADRLGVSRSAASQRLNIAESKLIREFSRVTCGVGTETAKSMTPVSPTAAD